MQYAEEFTAQRLNAFAEAERAREIELRRVIGERGSAVSAKRRARSWWRRSADAVPAVSETVVPETVTVETVPVDGGALETVTVESILAAAGTADAADSAAKSEPKELHAMVR